MHTHPPYFFRDAMRDQFMNPAHVSPSCSLPGQNFVASPDGSLLVVITPSSVDVYDAAGKTKVGRGVRPGRT